MCDIRAACRAASYTGSGSFLIIFGVVGVFELCLALNNTVRACLYLL